MAIFAACDFFRAAVERWRAPRVAARSIVRTIDRAISRGALHQNTAARKKSRAAKLVSGVGAAA